MSETSLGAFAVLTPSQKRALEALASGADVFLTGKAGSGKSFVLNLFLDACEKAGLQTVAMAPTGTAALNLRNGSTMHRTLKLRGQVFDPHSKRRLKSTVLEAADVVVVDEVSMCRLDVFDHFWAMVEAARLKGGARQVVVVGDFYQLPPVCTKHDQPALRELYPEADSWFAFSGYAWKRAAFTTCRLEEVVRQPDPVLASNLNLAREADASCIPYFNERVVSPRLAAPKDVIRLSATNAKAAAINDMRADELVSKGAIQDVYRADIEGAVNPGDMCVPERLRLVVGARVMLCANLAEQRLGNGSLGTLVKLHADSAEVLFDSKESPVTISPKTWEIKQTVVSTKPCPDDADGEKAAKRLTSDTVGSYTQLPLKLAFAITIHKAQGKTFDSCVVDTTAFEPGMLYVALSRCSTYEGLFLNEPIERYRLKANKAVLAAEAEALPAAAGEDRARQTPRSSGGVQGTLAFDGPSSLEGEDLADVLRENLSEILKELERDLPTSKQGPSANHSAEKVSIEVPVRLAPQVRDYIAKLVQEEGEC